MALPTWKNFIHAVNKGILPAILLSANVAQAQMPDSTLIRKAKQQYQGFHSVVLNVKERLDISFENGELVANSYLTQDRLVLTNTGATQNDVDLTYKDYFDRLTDVDATAYIPDGKGGYKTRKDYSIYSINNDESTFFNDIRTIAVAYPALTKNAVVRMTASHQHPDLNLLPRFTPEDQYPVMHYTLEVTAPDYVKFNFVRRGMYASQVTTTTSHANGKTTYTFGLSDVHAAKQFTAVPSSAHYRTQIIPILTSYRLPGEQKDSVLLADADHLYKYQYKYISNINLNIKNDTMLKRIVGDITQGDQLPRQKAAHIYDWVQKNVHYIAFEAGLTGFIPREADSVCKRKYGDCKDMSSLLVAMCRIAGMEAHYTWVGTTRLPYMSAEIASPMLFNHMICAVKLDGNWVFLDGTHPNLPFGTNGAAIQGKEAMVAIDEQSYQIVTIPENRPETNTITDSTIIHVSDADEHNIKGLVKQHLTGYYSWDFALGAFHLKDDEKEAFVKRMTERGNDKYIQTSYTISPVDTGAKDLSLTSKFRLEDYAQKIGKQYIINLNLNRKFDEAIVDTTARQVPFFFDFKNSCREVVVFEIPKGYKVNHLPKPSKGGLPGVWAYSMNYSTNGKTITLVKEYTLETLKMEPHQFESHNRLVAGLDQQYKESVVLTAK